MSNEKETRDMTVSVAYATAYEHFWRELKVPQLTHVREIIELSGVLSEFPNIDLKINKVGIFGKITSLDSLASEGDRIEIYRAITINPQYVPKKKYRLRPVVPFVESQRGNIVMDPVDHLDSGKEEGTMSLNGMLSEYGFVVKVDVTDIDRSIAWYRDKLGFQLDTRYSSGSWCQMTLSGLPNTALGLYANPQGAGLGGKRVTFVVEDIEKVRQRLLAAGVEIDEIETLGDWVKLAFLRDPDGNIFGIRQNLLKNEPG